MNSEISKCENCGGEAVPDQRAPADLDIEHNEYLCEECRNNQIRVVEDEKYFEERREEKKDKNVKMIPDGDQLCLAGNTMILTNAWHTYSRTVPENSLNI